MISVRINEQGQVDQRLGWLAKRISMAWDFGTPAEVLVRPYADKRSRAQNRLYWRWLEILADEFSKGTASHTKDDMHDLMRHKFLGTEEVQIGSEVITRLPSTAKLERGAMARYMQQIEQWAADMGVLLPMPADNEYAKYREAMQ